MKIDLNELEALARAATPGPWEATRQTDDECSFMGYFIEAGDKTISDDGTAPGHADALFIAAANPAAVLELIALARQAAGADTVAIPLVSGEELLTRTQPLPKWVDNMKGSGPTTDSLIEYIEQMRGAQPAQQLPPVADIEAAAKAIYAHLPAQQGNSPADYPWQDGGNSHMQALARDMARAALSAHPAKVAQVGELSDEQIKEIIFDCHAEDGMGQELDLTKLCRAILNAAKKGGA